MKVQTTTEALAAQERRVFQGRAELMSEFARLVKDPSLNLAWTEDVNLPFKPISSQALFSGLTLHTAKLPFAASRGSGQSSASKKSGSDEANVIQEIAKIKGPVGDFQILVTTSQLLNELFQKEKINKLKVASSSAKIISKVESKLRAFFPDLPPYVKFIGLGLDVGGKVCAFIADYEETMSSKSS